MSQTESIEPYQENNSNDSSYVIRCRARGRPRLNKPDKFAGMMRMTDRLKEYLISMKGPHETLAECNLRLLTKPLSN